jgi:uncharacterized protein YjiS (DUF1127 family)
MYFATVVALFVTTSLATNVLVSGTRGPALPGMIVGLRCRSRRLRRRLKRAIDIWVASMLAHRERQATIYAVHHLSDRELKDMGLYRGSLGHVTRPDGRRTTSPIPPFKDRRL